MSLSFRIVLMLFALAALAFVLWKIRKKQLLMADSVFWFIFALLTVILAIFPQVAFFFSNLLGVQSPSHLVFLGFIALLIVKEVNASVQISSLRNQVADLVQEEALRNGEEDADKGSEDARGPMSSDGEGVVR